MRRLAARAFLAASLAAALAFRASRLAFARALIARLRAFALALRAAIRAARSFAAELRELFPCCDPAPLSPDPSVEEEPQPATAASRATMSNAATMARLPGNPGFWPNLFIVPAFHRSGRTGNPA